MKIITDGFKAMDAMEYAKSEGCTIVVTKNTITVSERLIPRIRLCQIRTKNLSEDVMDVINKYLNK